MDKAVIFDMDGVLVDNNPWHVKAWMTFCKRHSVTMTIENITANFGNTNEDYLNFLFGRQLSVHEIDKFSEEKEGVYREIYRNEIKPLNGLLGLLDLLETEKYAIGLATSAPAKNVDFTLEALGIKARFNVIVDVTSITKGKPDPEIYLLASERLGIPVYNCIVFEDSIHGVQSAVSAGMNTVGVLTTQTSEKLSKAHYLVNDFTEVTSELLEKVLRTKFHLNIRK
jgi:beta-phosphoglucomutase